jgi:hypothetical protein
VTGALGGLIALGIHSLFDFNLHLPSNALLSVTFGAVLLARVDPVFARPLARLPAATALAGLVLALATSWKSPRYDPGVLRRGGPTAAFLRRAALERGAQAYVRSRPADAIPWIALAWLHGAEAATARELAGWAARLDPTNPRLREASRSLLK